MPSAAAGGDTTPEYESASKEDIPPSGTLKKEMLSEEKIRTTISITMASRQNNPDSA